MNGMFIESDLPGIDNDQVSWSSVKSYVTLMLMFGCYEFSADERLRNKQGLTLYDVEDETVL